MGFKDRTSISEQIWQANYLITHLQCSIYENLKGFRSIDLSHLMSRRLSATIPPSPGCQKGHYLPDACARIYIKNRSQKHFQQENTLDNYT